MKRVMLVIMLAVLAGLFLGKYEPEGSIIVLLLIALAITGLEPTLRGKL